MSQGNASFPCSCLGGQSEGLAQQHIQGRALAVTGAQTLSPPKRNGHPVYFQSLNKNLQQ